MDSINSHRSTEPSAGSSSLQQYFESWAPVMDTVLLETDNDCALLRHHMSHRSAKTPFITTAQLSRRRVEHLFVDTRPYWWPVNNRSLDFGYFRRDNAILGILDTWIAKAQSANTVQLSLKQVLPLKAMARKSSVIDWEAHYSTAFLLLYCHQRWSGVKVFGL